MMRENKEPDILWLFTCEREKIMNKPMRSAKHNEAYQEVCISTVLFALSRIVISVYSNKINK